jgi:hypothetical protein
MQDPQAIVQAARSGSAPAAWKVLRPTRSNVPASAFLGAFAGCFVVFLLFFCSVVSLFVLGAAGAIKVAQQSNQSGSLPDPSGLLDWITHFGPIAAIMLAALPIVIIALSGVIGGTRAAASAKDSFLIITPEGVVEALSKNRISAIDFAALEDITTLLVVRDNNTGTLLQLHYLGGKTRTWHPNRRFGIDQSVAQRIVKAFAEYATTVAARSRGIQ